MSTVINALAARLAEATAHNHATEQPPAVVLWTDGDRKWEAAFPMLRARLPQLWTWGEYDPALNQGPAAWIKWRLGHVAASDVVPVIYLPGVRRLEFRSLEDFPDALRPIAELQFRGTWWTQQNTKDWTPLAFLSSSNGGLGLPVAEDANTIAALDQLVSRVLTADIAELSKPARLEAEHFAALLTGDLEGDLLAWLDAPDLVRKSRTEAEWSVFCTLVKSKLAVDLDRDSATVVGEHLVQRNGGWKVVWERYERGVPTSYRNVHVVLERAQPLTLMFDKSTLPRHNDEQEQALRAKLVAVGQQPEIAARKAVRELEVAHSARRTWVWAKLGKARMARVLEHLAALADATDGEIGGSTRDALATWYADEGHEADAAALAALSLADHADGAVIYAAVRALYLPWLQRVAERLREVVAATGYPTPLPVAVEPGTCLLFADGLRWDVGANLTERLLGARYDVECEGRWVAFPPVTGTSKFDVSPIRAQLVGGTGAADFTPSVRGTGKPVDSATFRKLMADAGVQVLAGNDTGDPDGRGWTEFGDIDKYGHMHGCKTARHVDDQVRELEQRIAELLAAGWAQVRVTTDHGWLLVPGGMPPAKVPPGLSESRWGRCAMLKSTSKADLPSLPWAWDAAVEVTYAPGVCAFYAGTEYAHGGLTLQECYTPVLTIRLDQPLVTAKIGDLKWVGLRCKVTSTSSAAGLRLDLRTKLADPKTTVLDAPKAFSTENTCTVYVTKDREEGTAAFAVLLAPDGTVIDKRSTTIGGDA